MFLSHEQQLEVISKPKVVSHFGDLRWGTSIHTTHKLLGWIQVKNIWLDCWAPGSFMTVWRQPEPPRPFMCIRPIPLGCALHKAFGLQVRVIGRQYTKLRFWRQFWIFKNVTREVDYTSTEYLVKNTFVFSWVYWTVNSPISLIERSIFVCQL